MSLNLDNVTIICIDGVNPNVGVKALKYSMQEINFAQSIILSHIKPDIIPDGVEYIKIPELTHHTYSSFCLHELYKYFTTDFVLIIHDDGFVINPHKWTNEFLNYDYIGAPWRGEGNNRVGNGGFSLRSKKLVNLCRAIQWGGGHEDGEICITQRQLFVNNGCKFAPTELAALFSLESKLHDVEYNLENSFGFHGKGVVESVHFGEGQQFKDKLKLRDAVIL